MGGDDGDDDGDDDDGGDDGGDGGDGGPSSHILSSVNVSPCNSDLKISKNIIKNTTTRNFRLELLCMPDCAIFRVFGNPAR